MKSSAVKKHQRHSKKASKKSIREILWHVKLSFN